MCILCSKGTGYGQCIGVAVLIVVTTIVAVCEIVVAVVGFVTGGDLRSVGEYHSVGGF